MDLTYGVFGSAVTPKDAIVVQVTEFREPKSLVLWDGVNEQSAQYTPGTGKPIPAAGSIIKITSNGFKRLKQKWNIAKFETVRDGEKEKIEKILAPTPTTSKTAPVEIPSPVPSLSELPEARKIIPLFRAMVQSVGNVQPTNNEPDKKIARLVLADATGSINMAFFDKQIAQHKFVETFRPGMALEIRNGTTNEPTEKDYRYTATLRTNFWVTQSVLIDVLDNWEPILPECVKIKQIMKLKKECDINILGYIEAVEKFDGSQRTLKLRDNSSDDQLTVVIPKEFSHQIQPNEYESKFIFFGNLHHADGIVKMIPQKTVYWLTRNSMAKAIFENFLKEELLEPNSMSFLDETMNDIESDTVSLNKRKSKDSHQSVDSKLPKTH
ncbi:uncharacterized protein LOC129601211 isoform X1 [Paramacrobiotus metropolitanus]|uniref:uncharacterized protein LOC129601211 isoform X1 n=1 Tax=Paramacrobiotus metropolitanus TaxID=2943436 RepID=UPI0024457BC1|nr:uncharacterized protein LOC129601211 isoform X1 [Paramacrobiotus metropolitanus]